MKNCKKFCVVALIVFLFGQFSVRNEACAQVIEVGGTVGLSYYMGDINPRMPFNQSRLGWGVLVRYYEGTRWAFRLTYSNLQLDGSDESSGYRPERGLSFTDNVNDIAVVAEFNFFDYFTGSKRNGITPYIFGGVSVLTFNPKAEDGTELNTVLTDVDYDGNIPVNGDSKYSTLAVSIPFGLGMKCSISRRLGMALEWRWHYAFTDWLDDCHAYYPKYTSSSPYAQYADPTGFCADQSGANPNEYIQRGNPADNDWYSYLNVSLTYKFNLPQSKNCNVKGKYKNFD